MSVELAWIKTGICHSVWYLRAHSVIQHLNELASNVTNGLAMGYCIMERVERLAGNEIELGMEIPTIESNILMDKGNNVCCYAV